MTIKLLLLIFIFLMVIAPALLSDRLMAKEGFPLLRDIKPKRKSYPRWKGPKTDERINQMLLESIALMKKLGVPISESICPTVALNASHCSFGQCCPKGSKKKYAEYEYYIEISGFTLNNTEKSLRNTLIHELIHTVPGGDGHTGEWKRWAKFVSDKTEYHISRCGVEDETGRDLFNLRLGRMEAGHGRTQV